MCSRRVWLVRRSLRVSGWRKASDLEVWTLTYLGPADLDTEEPPSG